LGDASEKRTGFDSIITYLRIAKAFVPVSPTYDKPFCHKTFAML
jgi:hypothetical protein